MENFIISAQPYALEVVGLALTAVIGFAANKARQKWGLDIEEKHRLALHQALMTAARLALAKQLTVATAVEMMLGYAKQSVPDALRKLNPPQAVIESLAKAKLEQVKAEPAFQAGQAIGEAIKQAVR